MGRSVSQFNLNKREQEVLKKGLTDQLNGVKPQIEVEGMQPKLREMERARASQISAQYLEKAAKEKGAEKMPSGLVYKVVKEGTGDSPKASDKVRVHYRG